MENQLDKKNDFYSDASKTTVCCSSPKFEHLFWPGKSLFFLHRQGYSSLDGPRLGFRFLPPPGNKKSHVRFSCKDRSLRRPTFACH